MRQRWMDHGGTKRGVWEKDALRYVQHIEGLEALEHIDTDLQPLWMISPTQEVEAADRGREAWRRYELPDGVPVISTRFMALADGTTGVFVYLPLESEGGMDGYLRATFALDGIFSAVRPQSDPGRQDGLLRVLYAGGLQVQSDPEFDRSSEQLVERRVACHGMEWRMQLKPTEAFVASQRGRLPNLVGNALKYRGSETPRIEIRAEGDGESWVFSVKDNGIGFDPAQKERTFKVFQRLHGQEAFPGTGIGLAICKKIAERMDGRIWAESGEGEGATFYFTIPRDLESIRSA